MKTGSKPFDPGIVILITCMVIMATYAMMIDLKGITTDEGVRMAIINGNEPYRLGVVPDATWAEVIEANSSLAYQPLYYLILNSLMRISGTHDVLFFRFVNIFFLWVCLQGLISLTKSWNLLPRVFLLGLFSFNAYLFMHVLQIREYIVGVAFYIWSTWLVLLLDRRKLEHGWIDAAWFSFYGVLLALGFYLQTWVVFPAVGQFIFLVLKRREAQVRFYAHLILSYVIVISATQPYLQTNRQKVDVGQWGTEGIPLWPQIADGFHLVLTGHMANHSGFYSFLCWFWPLLILVAAVLLFGRKWNGTVNPGIIRETKRQGLLMLLCIAIPLSFQIAYFYKVDTLSVWARYFIIHYFFLTWLIGLSFKYFCELRASESVSLRLRRTLTATISIAVAILLVSIPLQTRSYYRNPLLDAGFTKEANWRMVASELSRHIHATDVIVSRDYILRSTLTFTRPMVNPAWVLADLQTRDLKDVQRLVYVEPKYYISERTELQAELKDQGFSEMKAIELHTPDGNRVIDDWQFLIFSRR